MNKWNNLEHTMDILESLPASLKSFYMGILLDFREDLKELDGRVSHFFAEHPNLKAVR